MTETECIFCEIVAGQEMFHVPLRLIPRFAGDDFGIVADFSASPSRAELDAVASKIRDASPTT